MDKLAIKVVLNPLTTPRLYSHLAEIADSRLRAELFRRLAEFGAEALQSMSNGMGASSSSLTILAAMTRQSATVLGNSTRSTEAVHPNRQVAASINRVDSPEQQEDGGDAKVAPPVLTAETSGFDLDKMNAAMSRYF
ncbi:hypothetical protein AU476_06225 [Cupriavidus sp. UYMSc13B]|nr:hypothetical protein AU476_06225 [Cupriavidus sp. UYMSc13B]